MIYATAADMQLRYGQAELIQLTDPDGQAVQTDRLQRALEDAQAFADGYVGRVYQLPLTGCAKPAPVPGNPGALALVPPPQLTRICCDVARYYLYDDLAPEHEVAARYKAAERELLAIAEGRATLACPWGGAPGQALAEGSAGDGETWYAFSPRSVTDEAAGRYR